MTTWPQFIDWLRRWERRYFYSDYAEAWLREQWLNCPETLQVEEVRFGLMPEKANLKSVVVFKPDDIGDAVHALPALMELRKALPQSRISVIARPATSVIFERTGVADDVISVQVKTYFRRFPKVSGLPSLKSDLAIFLRTHPSYFGQFRKLSSNAHLHPRDPRMPSRSPYQVFVNPWGERGEHQALQMLRLVSPITQKRYGHSDLLYPQWHWTEGEIAHVTGLLGDSHRPFGVIHPYVKDETRRYPEPYWKELLTQLKKHVDLDWFVIGSPQDEGPLFDGMAQNLKGKLSLAETAFLISRGKAFLGVMSGPAHLSASLGTPTITLSGGASYPREWAPLGKSLLLRTDLACAPCNLKSCPGNQLLCLTELTPARVFPEIERFLSANGVSVRRV